MKKKTLIFFLILSFFIDLISMSIISSFTVLESNPIYIKMGLWGFILLKTFVNFGFIFLFYKYSKNKSNFLSFATYYLLIIFTFAQFFGGVTNIITINNIYNDIQEKTNNEYDNIFDVPQEEIEEYTLPADVAIKYYIQFILITIILPIVLSLFSFFCWDKNEKKRFKYEYY